MNSQTIGNEQPLLYGRKYNEDNAYNINIYFQENVDITGLENAFCGKESSVINWKKKKGKIVQRHGND